MSDTLHKSISVGVSLFFVLVIASAAMSAVPDGEETFTTTSQLDVNSFTVPSDSMNLLIADDRFTIDNGEQNLPIDVYEVTE